MNVSKKRKNMFILEEYLYSLKMKFNNSVKRLRLEKEELIDLITNHNVRIQQINESLGVKEDLFTPKIDIGPEYPEKFYEISITELQIYKTEKDKKSKYKSKP